MLRHLSRLRITRASEPKDDPDASTLASSTQSKDTAATTSAEEGGEAANDGSNEAANSAPADGEDAALINNAANALRAAGDGDAGSDDVCQALVDMGFDREQASQALLASGGDVSDAVVALVSRGATVQEGHPGVVAGSRLVGDGESMDAFDAVLSEALRLSEQEAESEHKLRADEQASLDAALAASLDCIGGSPAPPLTGLVVPPDPAPQPSENIAAPLPPSKGSKHRAEERHHSASKVEGDEHRIKSKHGTRRSRRSSHEAPRRPSLEVPEAHGGSFPSSPQSESSLHSPGQARVRSKQMLPPLSVPRHVKPVTPGGLDDRLSTPHRLVSKGSHKVLGQDELPALSRRFSDTRLVPPSTPGQAAARSLHAPPPTPGHQGRSPEEVIDLDEIENWSKGAASARHPSKGVPTSSQKHTALLGGARPISRSGPGASPTRQTSHGTATPPTNAAPAQFGFSRPMSRSGLGAGGSQPLRCPAAPKPGTAGATGSAFRAAVALSLS